jgi:NurA-like 5'-3' nuclease
LRFYLEDIGSIDEGSYIEKFFSLYQKFIRAAYNLITKCILSDIILVGVSKDSRADILIKSLYSDSKKRPPINDVSLINVISGGKAGFTKPIEFSPKISPVRQKVWKAANVFQEKELQSFYLSYFVLKEGAQPIRVDSLLPQKKRLKEIQEAMVTYHDGNGFITPAYLTHKKAHMSADYGARIVNLVAEKIFQESPEVYKAFLSKRRRDVIQ